MVFLVYSLGFYKLKIRQLEVHVHVAYWTNPKIKQNFVPRENTRAWNQVRLRFVLTNMQVLVLVFEDRKRVERVGNKVEVLSHWMTKTGIWWGIARGWKGLVNASLSYGIISSARWARLEIIIALRLLFLLQVGLLILGLKPSSPILLIWPL